MNQAHNPNQDRNTPNSYINIRVRIIDASANAVANIVANTLDSRQVSSEVQPTVVLTEVTSTDLQPTREESARAYVADTLRFAEMEQKDAA